MAEQNKQPEVHFISGYSDSRWPELDGDELHNATIIPSASPTSRSPTALVQRAGIKLRLAIPNIRWAFTSFTLNKQIILVDNELRVYDLQNTDTYSVISGITITYDTPRLIATDTFTGVVISDQTLGYFIDASLNVTLITGSNWAPTKSLTFIDGYVIINQTGTRFFNYSELNDTQFDNGLFTAAMAGDVDKIKSVAAINRELYLFGEKHTEIWANTAYDVNTVFTAQQGRVIHQGIISDNTIVINGIGYNVAQGDNQFGVYAWTAGSSTKISCGAIEQELMDAKTSIRLLTMYEDNRQFILVLIDGTRLWCFDVESKVWATREYFENLIDILKIGAKYYLVFPSGVHEITGTDDNGALINSYKKTSHIVQLNNRIFHKMIEIDCGGDVATLELLYSDDGGYSYKNAMFSIVATIGKMNRYRFNRLGSSRDRVYKLCWSSAYNAGIYNAYSDLEVGLK